MTTPAPAAEQTAYLAIKQTLARLDLEIKRQIRTAGMVYRAGMSPELGQRCSNALETARNDRQWYTLQEELAQAERALLMWATRRVRAADLVQLRSQDPGTLTEEQQFTVAMLRVLPNVPRSQRARALHWATNLDPYPQPQAAAA